MSWSSGQLFISESDLAIMQLAQAVVADSDVKDVGGEILEGLADLSPRVRNGPPSLSARPGPVLEQTVPCA